MVRCAQPMPAELTSDAQRAELLGRSTAALICSVLVTSTWAKTPPISCGERLALLGVEVGDDDLRALGGELAGDGRADARGAAGDDGTGSVDVHGAGAYGSRQARTAGRAAVSTSSTTGAVTTRSTTGWRSEVGRRPRRSARPGRSSAPGRRRSRRPARVPPGTSTLYGVPRSAPSARRGGDHHGAGAGAAGPGLAGAALVHPHRDVLLAAAHDELDVDAVGVGRRVVRRGPRCSGPASSRSSTNATACGLPMLDVAAA